MLAIAVAAGVTLSGASSDVSTNIWGGRAATRIQGVGSCAAAGCHNANGPAGSEGSEYSTWAGRDKHARAYEVLREPRSVEMVRKLGWGKKAHEEDRCLVCHSTSDAHGGLPADILADGVGCEACHGPSEKWR